MLHRTMGLKCWSSCSKFRLKLIFYFTFGCISMTVVVAFGYGEIHFNLLLELRSWYWIFLSLLGVLRCYFHLDVQYAFLFCFIFFKFSFHFSLIVHVSFVFIIISNFYLYLLYKNFSLSVLGRHTLIQVDQMAWQATVRSALLLWTVSWIPPTLGRTETVWSLMDRLIIFYCP